MCKGFHFERDTSWQRQLIPQLEKVWREVLSGREVVRIVEASFEADYYEETDMFAITRTSRLGLANRVRSYYHYVHHRGDFTIRNSGKVTELQRIVDLGYGDYYLYAFADGAKQKLIAWVVLDLNVFREEYKHAVRAMILNLDQRRAQWTTKEPKGGTPFLAFKLETFVPDIVIASYNHNRLPRGDNTK